MARSELELSLVEDTLFNQYQHRFQQVMKAGEALVRAEEVRKRCCSFEEKPYPEHQLEEEQTNYRILRLV